MIYLKYLFLIFFSLAAGFTVSGGVFTALITVGLIPRFAGRTHTGSRVFFYEEMVVLGTLVGSFFSIFNPFVFLHNHLSEGVEFWRKLLGDHFFDTGLLGHLENPILYNTGIGLLILYGFFAGIFVGCLALAIAEMLNSIPIFARRIGFRHGLGVAVLCIALGKACGSLLYFLKQFYESNP